MRTDIFRVLGIACAAVLLAGTASALTHDPASLDAPDELTAGERSSTTTTSQATGPTTPGEKGAQTTAPTTGAADPTETTAAPASTTPPTTTPPPADAPLGTTATTPGTYVYDVRGTVDGEPVSGTSTLTVEAPDVEGRQRQVQEAPDGTTTTVYRFTTEGTFLESITIESPRSPEPMELRATTPFLILPAGAEAGTTASGVLEGDDLRADVTVVLTDRGPDESTVQVDAELSGTMSGFEVDGTMASTILGRTADQLPLEIDSQSDVSAGGGLVRTTSDIHAVLRS